MLFTGDPAGIGPEISARMLGGPAPCPAADVRVVTSRAVMADAVSITGWPFAFAGGGLDERGVTVPGGLPMPIATPAHGTAYDIAGRGVAHVGAMTHAFRLACPMAERGPGGDAAAGQ